MTAVQRRPLHQPCTLQQTLNGLHTWAENHKMKHNPKNTMPTLSINQKLLKGRDTVKLLGVTCDRTVRWTTCWPQSTENSLLCVAFRKFGVKDSELLSIYTGCRCPVLEHIAPVWHSFLTTDQSNRETVPVKPLLAMRYWGYKDALCTVALSLRDALSCVSDLPEN